MAGDEKKEPVSAEQLAGYIADNTHAAGAALETLDASKQMFYKWVTDTFLGTPPNPNAIQHATDGLTKALTDVRTKGA